MVVHCHFTNHLEIPPRSQPICEPPARWRNNFHWHHSQTGGSAYSNRSNITYYANVFQSYPKYWHLHAIALHLSLRFSNGLGFLDGIDHLHQELFLNLGPAGLSKGALSEILAVGSAGVNHPYIVHERISTNTHI